MDWDGSRLAVSINTISDGLGGLCGKQSCPVVVYRIPTHRADLEDPPLGPVRFLWYEARGPMLNLMMNGALPVR